MIIGGALFEVSSLEAALEAALEQILNKQTKRETTGITNCLLISDKYIISNALCMKLTTRFFDWTTYLYIQIYRIFDNIAFEKL